MPKSIQTYLNQARNAYQNRSFDEAEALLGKAVQLEPANAEALHGLGVLHDQRKNYDQAAEYYRRAINAEPGNAVYRRGLAALLFETGEHDESRALYEGLIHDNPNDVDAHFAYSRLTAYRADDPTLAALQIAGNNLGRIAPEERVRLCFTIGKAQQDLGEYAQAFEAFAAGNALHYKLHPYNEAANYALLGDLRDCIDASLLQRFAKAGDRDPSPIFVLGMPRSGSTLVEQMLASHSDVAAAGEVKYLKQCIQTHLVGDKQTIANALPEWTEESIQAAASDYLLHLNLHADGKARVVDKMPGNFAFVGLIALLFPQAKIVHTVRHPMATLWSNYSTHFGDALYYTYDFDVLARYFGKYREMMVHWRSVLPANAVFDLHYEELVSDPEATLRELLEYLGLEWQSSCLDFYRLSRNVKTASVAQVRQPLYATAVAQWENYREQLRPWESQLLEH